MGQLYNEDWEHVDIEAFREAIIKNGVISGLQVTESSPAAMTIQVSAGQCTVDGVVYSEAANQNLNISNGDATHDRKDIIVYDTTVGNPAVVAGTPAAAATPPDIPAGDILLGIVIVEANEVTSIVNSDITEDRVYAIDRWSYTAVSANTTLNDAHKVVTVNATGGARTITLPTAVGITGKVYVIKKTDSSTNGVIIDGNGAQTIDGSTTITIDDQYDTIMIQSDGTNWQRLSNIITKVLKNVVIKALDDDDTLTIGDAKTHFTVPIEFDGMNLITVGAHVYAQSTSGTPTFQVHNLTSAQDMLSTAITIDANESDSKDAATPAVVNTAQDDISTGDVIRFDCDVCGTGTEGMEIRLGFTTP